MLGLLKNLERMFVFGTTRTSGDTHQGHFEVWYEGVLEPEERATILVTAK
jgi:hypothetical protein